MKLQSIHIGHSEENRERRHGGISMGAIRVKYQLPLCKSIHQEDNAVLRRVSIAKIRYFCAHLIHK